MNLRLFYAIQFSDEIKQFFTDVQVPLKAQSIKGNFTYIDNLHLTLRYIGEVNSTQEQKLRGILDSSFNNIEKFDLTTNGLGSFQRGNTEIIWVGLEDSPQLLEIYSRLEESLSENGFEREQRPYKPHITLGREVVLKEKSLLNYQIPSKEIKVEKIALVNSMRVKGRLIYIPIQTVDLK